MKVLYPENTKFGRKNLARRKIFWKFELKPKHFFVTTFLLCWLRTFNNLLKLFCVFVEDGINHLVCFPSESFPSSKRNQEVNKVENSSDDAESTHGQSGVVISCVTLRLSGCDETVS